MERVRIAYLDVIRVIACMMVILMHSPLPGNGAPAYVLTGISFVTAPCIGLFFMVSGALLLPVNMTMKSFYKRRLLKVVIPTLIWTIVYLLIGWGQGSVSHQLLLKDAISIPFSAQGNGIMWFMYTLIGLYLLSPIISPWLEKASNSEVEFVLCLWFISLCFPLISRYVIVNEGDTGLLYYFSGYAGYYLLGYYINRYQTRIGILPSVLMIFLPIVLCCLIIKNDPDVDFYKCFWYLSIFVALMTCGWFCLLRKLRIQDCKFLSVASSLSFGIYLCHILIMRFFLWQCKWLCGSGWFSQILFTTILTMCIAFVLCYLIALLPFGKYIIGSQLNNTIR